MSQKTLLLVMQLTLALTLAVAACSPLRIEIAPTGAAPVNTDAARVPSGSLQPTSAASQSVRSPGKGAVSVSFDPNPVPEGNDWNKGFWIFNVILKETNGVGMTIKSLAVRYFSNDGSIVSSYDYNSKEWFASWLPSGYLAANGKVATSAGLPVQSTVGYGVYTYSGTDDNGNEIQAIGRVDFSK